MGDTGSVLSHSQASAVIYRFTSTNMLKTLSLWGICFLGIWCPGSMCSLDTVTRKKVLRGTNVTFGCPFPYHLNVSNIIAYWWKDGNKSFLQEDDRKVFTVKRAGAYLHLLNITVPDAGTYCCVVKHQLQTVGKGISVRLLVYAAPVPLRIVSIPFDDTASTFLRLQCRTAEFHPRDFNLTWYKNGTEIKTGYITKQRETAEGLYEVISSFEEAWPTEQGTVYTCRVHHVSISGPANGSYTVGNVDYHFVLPIRLIYRSTVGLLILLVLMVISFDHITSERAQCISVYGRFEESFPYLVTELYCAKKNLEKYSVPRETTAIKVKRSLSERAPDKEISQQINE